jgi:hypothetical protein
MERVVLLGVVCVLGAGCYDARVGSEAGPRMAEPSIRFDSPDVLDRLPPSPPAAAGFAAPAPVPDAGSAQPEPYGDDIPGCLRGSAAVYDGDYNTSPAVRQRLVDLVGIREVSGVLALSHTDSQHFDELRCLQKVGSLHITANARLESLRGFVRLTDVPGFIYVTRNPRLRDLRGLAGVQGTLGRFQHERCPEIAHCASGALVIEQNDTLRSLAGLQGITEVIGSVMIALNPTLSGSDGLSGLRRITGSLRILQGALTSLAGLSSLTHVEGDLSLTGNWNLDGAGGPAAIREVDGTVVIARSALANLALLSNLERAGSLTIESNSAMRDLSGLERLVSIERGLWIYDNRRLESLEGLSGVRGQLGVQPEPGWPLSAVPSTFEISIEANPSLRSLRGLEGIERVGGGMFLGGNHALEDLRGLDGLAAVHGTLEIAHNAGLTSLDGLNALTRVGRNLLVNDNERLADVRALDNLEYVAALLDLTGNPNLSDVNLPSLSHARTLLLP